MSDPTLSLAHPPLPRQERRARIEGALAGASRQHWVPLRQGYRSVPAVELPHEVLVYRVDNGRLIAALREQCGSDGTNLENLRQQEDTPTTQSLLHDLLISKALDPRGPIFAELERQGVQTDPILIDAQGVVINGNRRLAAMRVLVARDPERYVRLQHPWVAVLPSELSAGDLEFIEASLQMAPETKLAYSWIDRRLKLREQRDHLHLSPQWIRDAYRLTDVGQLDREIEELRLAETFLEEFLGNSGRFSLLLDAEALFAGLQCQLFSLPSGEQQFWSTAGFLLIETRASLQEANLDRHFPFADPLSPSLPLATRQRWALDLACASDSPDDLIKMITASTDRPLLACSLVELMEELRMQHREARTPQRLLTRIKDVRKLMDRLQASDLSEPQRSRLRGELAALQAQAAHLIDEPAHPLPPSRRQRLRRFLGRLLRG